MKTYPLTIKLLAVLTVSAFACMQARADNIAENAMAAEKSEKAPDVLTTPPHRVSEKQTGIKAPAGTLIHPVIQSTGMPPARIGGMHATQEDYHSQQTY